MRKLLPLVTVGALFAVSLQAAPARAAPSDSAIVLYSDLDLGRPSGAAALDRRIDHAIRSLCGSASLADLKDRNAIRRCRDEARRSIAARRAQLIEAAARRQPAATAFRQ